MHLIETNFRKSAKLIEILQVFCVCANSPINNANEFLKKKKTNLNKLNKMKNQDHNIEYTINTANNLKRKWYYDQESSINTSQSAKTIRKSLCYDYENYQPNHQLSPVSVAVPQSAQHPQQEEQHLPPPPATSSSSTQLTYTVDTTMTKMDHSHNIELNESVEYVNILYDNNLLSSVQSPIITEPNFINFETNWNSADILDLDQREYYYETTVQNDHASATAEQMYHENGKLSDEQAHIEMQEHINMPTVNVATPAQSATESSRK